MIELNSKFVTSCFTDSAKVTCVEVHRPEETSEHWLQYHTALDGSTLVTEYLEAFQTWYVHELEKEKPIKVRASHITTNSKKWPISRSVTTDDEVDVFENSQFFPAIDGSWLMVDWIAFSDGKWNWYVTECENFNE